MEIYQEILNRKQSIAVIGLGYVGLPVALAFAKKVRVIAFDTDENRIEKLRNKIDPSDGIKGEEFEACNIHFTSIEEDLRHAAFYIITVPTPVDENKTPDLHNLKKASSTIGNVIAEGNYVIFESTVYPGCTEEDCVPIIEKISGLKAGLDFKVGYSPERINVGDELHTFQSIVKVVSGCDAEASSEIKKVYELVVEAGVYEASSIKVAEAAKVIENTQRDLNIALMNELSLIFETMNINTAEVLEAAATKWNFLKFQPGLVGGHCIGVDPYYLTYKATSLGYEPKVILAGREVNDEMGRYVADKVFQHIELHMKEGDEMNVLVMGVTFKENIDDVRNSRVIDVVERLKEHGVHVDIVDPRASGDSLKELYGVTLTKELSTKYNAIILAVRHQEYCHYEESYFASLLKPSGLFADVKGHYRHVVKQLHYWSL